MCFQEANSTSVAPNLTGFSKASLAPAKSCGITPRFKIISEDPDDDVVLNVAYSARADYVVTGEKHLLALDRFRNTRILTVGEMLETLV